MKETQVKLKPHSKHLFGMDIPSEPGTYFVILERGQTAWQPGTTKYFFGGPGKLTYIVYSDGDVIAVTSKTILRRIPADT